MSSKLLAILALVVSVSPALAESGGGDGGTVMPGYVADSVGSPNAAPGGFSNGTPGFEAAQSALRYFAGRSGDTGRNVAARAVQVPRG